MGGLFNGSRVEADFKQRRNRARSQITELESIGDVEHTTDKIFKQHRVEGAIFRRGDATFEHEPGDRGIDVTMMVPFDGAATCFLLIPKGTSPYSISTDGEVVNPSRRWLDEGEPVPKHIAFNKTFEEPTDEDVRGWGRQQADLVEQTLSAVHAEVEEGNAWLHNEIATAVRDRQRTLRAGEGLGDLGTGI